MLFWVALSLYTSDKGALPETELCVVATLTTGAAVRLRNEAAWARGGSGGGATVLVVDGPEIEADAAWFVVARRELVAVGFDDGNESFVS
mmetsp:Transcript_28708/g.61824  ORF Transcript_28708/g.61824 Transcript_28708/m.61824 type:complete len:90 (+) Transcript_28708:353-622(+)